MRIFLSLPSPELSAKKREFANIDEKSRGAEGMLQPTGMRDTSTGGGWENTCADHGMSRRSFLQ